MRFGIIGTNVISGGFVRAAKKVPEVALHAVHSRKTQSAERFIERHLDGAEPVKIYTDIESLARDKEIDAVYVASPNALHCEQAVLLLNAGKHVLGEKPSATNVSELERIYAAARQNQRCFMEALLTTHMPNYKVLKEQLHRIGVPRKYIGQYCQYSSRYDLYKQGQSINTFMPEFSNGALMDLGIYPLSPVIDLWGVPDKIQANSLFLDSGVDGATDLLLDYADKQASISCSKISNGHNITEIQGELGRIEIDFVSFIKKIRLYLNDGTVENLGVEQDLDIMRYEIEHFVQLIKRGSIESDINSWSFSQSVLSVIEQARKQVGLVYPGDNR
ncbi:Gfo/Idh/MocA family protein [Lacimicrobium alkaliphilum]|uniref:Gfo/Idh/MocA family protein n=1 Tax=Lacimicrobium alkaliphilum TaxID=1526571 RepID=UPI000BFEC7FB|nr:Gfo/Idh/MocA family oxidoreductase [Lacimicrobium alkaliphilum]